MKIKWEMGSSQIYDTIDDWNQMKFDSMAEWTNRENLLLSVRFLQISLESFVLRLISRPLFPVHKTSMANMSTCMFWVTLRFISNLHWLNDGKIQSNTILEWDPMVKSNRRRVGCWLFAGCVCYIDGWCLKHIRVYICWASILNWMFGALCLPFTLQFSPHCLM